MTLKNTITGALAAGAVYAAMAMPAFAATEITVEGNSVGSDTGVVVVENNSSVVTQSNVSDVFNSVNTVQNTGFNSSSFNFGGSRVTSGNAVSNVVIENYGGVNENTDDCGCAEEDVTVDVTDNGYFSDTFVGVFKNKHKAVTQTNSSFFSNTVNTVQNTGKNRAGFGFGGFVKSGHARSTVGIFNGGNGNSN